MIFKQAFRVAFVVLIWKQYKHWIVSTLLLILSLILISRIHSDFLHHWQIQQDISQTGISFVYKWLGFAISILLYIGYHYFRPKKVNLSKEKQAVIEQELANLTDEDDPFSAIRSRKKLRSRADFMMNDDKEESK